MLASQSLKTIKQSEPTKVMMVMVLILRGDGVDDDYNDDDDDDQIPGRGASKSIILRFNLTA